MAYNEFLADRIRQHLQEKKTVFEEKKMMGGLCFMVDGKMLAGVTNDSLMARIGPDAWEPALQRKGCREMNFTGRSMKGFVLVEPAGLDTDEDLAHWLQLCLDYNPIAKASRKKK